MDNVGNYNQCDVKVKDVPLNKTNIKNKNQNTDTDKVGNSNQGDVKVKDVPLNKTNIKKKMQIRTMLVTLNKVI